MAWRTVVRTSGRAGSVMAGSVPAVHAAATFVVDRFEPEPPYAQDGDVGYARVRVAKTFAGDLVGTGSVELLAARAGEGAGAGYVALERIEGSLHGREGAFAVLHLGLDTGVAQEGRWPIVPGSGTGALAGIRGEGRIAIDADGGHAFELDYELEQP